MKSTLMLAMTVVMVLGSVKAMAAQSAGSVDPVELENTLGKVDASELNVNVEKVRQQINEMQDLQKSLSEVDDTQGVMPALGQTIEGAENDLKEIESTSDLEKSRQLVNEVQRVLVRAKAQINKL